MTMEKKGMQEQLNKRRLIVDWLVIAVVYIISARLGLLFSLAHGSVSLIWPPAGIALAVVTAWGVRMLPGVFLGAYVANLFGGDPWQFPVAAAFGNSVEAFVGAFLLRHLLHFRCEMDRTRDILGLPLLAAPVSAVLAATIGVVSLWSIGSVTTGAFARTWFHWWLGDVIGMIVVTPVIFVLVAYGLPKRMLWQQWMECTAFMVAAFMGGLTLFGSVFPAWPALSILVIPLLILVAFRFTPREVVFANLLVAIGATIGVERTLGQAHPEALARGLLTLCVLLLVSSLTVQLLAALRVERNRTEKGLRAERQQLLDIIEFLPDATFIIDDQKRVTAWNHAMEMMTG